MLTAIQHQRRLLFIDASLFQCLEILFNGTDCIGYQLQTIMHVKSFRNF